jgi:ribosomal protein S18 acetylase RimI-like enzyme
MTARTIHVRLLEPRDFDAVVAIDAKVVGERRTTYYEMKFEKIFRSRDHVPTSLVAELEDGRVVGFVMGELYMGEYGIPSEGASLDTIGVDLDFRSAGIGERLVSELVDHLRDLGVRKVNTLVARTDGKLIRFFESNSFVPSDTVNLERVV